ncbi:MAG TPA: amidase, partial [Candidatus Limnocylindrales bacterium]
MAAGLRTRDFSAVELATAHLDRIDATDHALHAWVWWDRELAMSQARAADERIATGESAALLGIPVALKDLVLTRGDKATAGSAILDGYVSPYDAHISERLRAAGAVLPGKTNMDEFAMGSSTEFSAYGPTSNPWDL